MELCNWKTTRIMKVNQVWDFVDLPQRLEKNVFFKTKGKAVRSINKYKVR